MKRANGSGSITRLSGRRRKPYMVRLSYRDEFDVLHQQVLGYYETKKAAQDALEEYNVDKNRGAAPLADRMALTLQQVWDSWSARELAGAGKSKKKAFNSAWGLRVSAYKDRQIRSISADDWQALVDQAVEAGASQSTVKNLITLCHALCRHALERDVIAKDYSQFMKAPAIAPKVEKGILTTDQIDTVAKMASDGVPWADTVLMLCYTGMRIEEFLSLTPESYCPDYGGYFTGGSKTTAGKNRVIPVHPRIDPHVQTWLSKAGQALICGDDGLKLGYKAYLLRFKQVVSEIGLPQATPHWCRHTFTSMAHDAGMDPLTVKWIVGHSTETDITHHYTHGNIELICKEMQKLPG